MTVLIVTKRDGSKVTVAAKLGNSVMQSLRDGGVDEVLALCGGTCSCATCHVYVSGGTPLAPMSADENDLLDSSPHRRENSRLSCQIMMSETMETLALEIAPED